MVGATAGEEIVAPILVRGPPDIGRLGEAVAGLKSTAGRGPRRRDHFQRLAVRVGLGDGNRIDQGIRVVRRRPRDVALARPHLVAAVLDNSPARAADGGRGAGNVDLVRRAQNLRDAAFVVMGKVGDEMQAAAARSGPARGGVRNLGCVNVVDPLGYGLGGDVVAGARQEAALVHLPGEVAVEVEVVAARVGDPGAVLLDGNHRQGGEPFLHGASARVPGVGVGRDDLWQASRRTRARRAGGTR